MDKKIGFIGCGNIGKAILGGLIASGPGGTGTNRFTPRRRTKVAALLDRYGINAASRPEKWRRLPISSSSAVKPRIMTKCWATITASSLNKESLRWSLSPPALHAEQLARARQPRSAKSFARCRIRASLVNAGMTSVTLTPW